MRASRTGLSCWGGRPFPLLRGQDEESSLTSKKGDARENNCSHRFEYVKSVVFQLHGVDRTEQPRVEGAEGTVKLTNWSGRAGRRAACQPPGVLSRRHGFPPEVICYAVWMYFPFP